MNFFNKPLTRGTLFKDTIVGTGLGLIGLYAVGKYLDKKFDKELEEMKKEETTEEVIIGEEETTEE